MRIGEWTRFLVVFFALAVCPAQADPEPVLATIQAHPALWTVHGGNATAYLFGSIHLLPDNINWHTQDVDNAIAASDVFVFEAPLDESGVDATSDFIRDHGTLPPNVTLTSLLNAKALKDYKEALAITHVNPDAVAHMRPWVAALVMEISFIRAEHYSPESGIDRQVFAIAHQKGKIIRSFESVGRQLSLLMPQNQKLELAEFEATMKEFRTEANQIGPLVDAWSHGQEALLAKLMNAALQSQPGARKALLDDRNVAWVKQLQPMLAEHHTYFITVGAGHLGGPRGIPALLRARGYKVDGP